jgi:predicted amidophosphoribosyltransferase
LPDAVLRAAEQGFRGLFDPLITLVFPDDCRVCGEPLKTVSRIPVCKSCLHEPEPLVAEFHCSTCRTPFVNRFPLDENGQCALCRLGMVGYDAVYSYGSYEGTLRKLIHLFKYEKIHTLAKPLGAFLARVLPREQRFDVIVPMPLHWWRRWERGFNQSELLAKEIARRWNVPVVRAVQRTKATASQAGLTNAKRRANVAGAFRVRKETKFAQFWKGRPLGGLLRFTGFFKQSPPLKGARVLLVDDVITTGASAAACAAALKRAGAKHVAVLAVARTDRRFAAIDLRVSSDSGAAVAAAPHISNSADSNSATLAAEAGGAS